VAAPGGKEGSQREPYRLPPFVAPFDRPNRPSSSIFILFVGDSVGTMAGTVTFLRVPTVPGDLALGVVRSRSPFRSRAAASFANSG
jgi:hypothetical protein